MISLTGRTWELVIHLGLGSVDGWVSIEANAEGGVGWMNEDYFALDVYYVGCCIIG